MHQSWTELSHEWGYIFALCLYLILLHPPYSGADVTFGMGATESTKKTQVCIYVYHYQQYQHLVESVSPYLIEIKA